MVISEKINDQLTEVVKCEIIKNDLSIEIKPYSGIKKENTFRKTTTIIEVPLPSYHFDLPVGPYKMKDMRIFYDLKTDMPRRLRGTLWGITQSHYIHTFETIDYLTIHEVIEFRDEFDELKQEFNLHIKYDYEIDPNLIVITFPLDC